MGVLQQHEQSGDNTLMVLSNYYLRFVALVELDGVVLPYLEAMKLHERPEYKNVDEDPLEPNCGKGT